jgi:hypothetical protein
MDVTLNPRTGRHWGPKPLKPVWTQDRVWQVGFSALHVLDSTFRPKKADSGKFDDTLVRHALEDKADHHPLRCRAQAVPVVSDCEIRLRQSGPRKARRRTKTRYLALTY